MHRIFGLSLFLILTIGAKDIAANTDDIVVVTVIGQVEAKSSEGSRPVTRGTRLQLSDTIVTGPSSKAQIHFRKDGTKVQIEENTKFLIEKYAYNKSPDDELKVSLLEGGLRWLSGDIQSVNKTATKLSTKVAVTGIRGTYFLSVLKNSTQVLGIYKGLGLFENQGGRAILGDDENFHLAVATAWDVAPRYLLEELGESFKAFSPIAGESGGDATDLDRLQDAIGDYLDDWFERNPSGPFMPGPFDGFIDFAYDNYYNNCRCHGRNR